MCLYVDDGCEESFVYRDCISCCPPTCTFEKECLGTNLHCLDGCYCPDGIQAKIFSNFCPLLSINQPWIHSCFQILFPTGLILQNGTCIAVSQCPCVYHGTSYVQGHVLQQGCSVWWVQLCIPLSACNMVKLLLIFVGALVFSVCMGGVWNCTENNCTGEIML